MIELVGIAATYDVTGHPSTEGARDGGRIPTRLERGCLSMAGDVPLVLGHSDEHPVGAITAWRHSPVGLLVRAVAWHPVVAVMLRSRPVDLSVAFTVAQEADDGAVRSVSAAVVDHVGLVDRGAFRGSRVTSWRQCRRGGWTA